MLGSYNIGCNTVEISAVSVAPFYRALQHGIENDCGEATMCKRVSLCACVCRVHACVVCTSANASIVEIAERTCAARCILRASTNSTDLRTEQTSAVEYVQRRFSEIPLLGRVARNRDPSNNSRCNNLATNVPRGSNNVANNDKFKEEKSMKRDTLEKHVLMGYKYQCISMVFT